MSKPWRNGDRVFSEVGSQFEPIYTPKVHENGVIELVETGKKNVYEEIQSHKDSVDIHVLLARYAEGDLSALGDKQGVYMDITDMPKTYAELFQRLKDGEAAFYKLPLDVREKFGHSFEKWLITSGTEEWIKNMGLLKVSVSEKEDIPVETEPKED